MRATPSSTLLGFFKESRYSRKVYIRKGRKPMQPMSIEPMRLASLRPHPGNARTHSKKQIRQIADSIRQFGFTNPVLIGEGGEIIAGHGRVEAAKLLGLGCLPTLSPAP